MRTAMVLRLLFFLLLLLLLLVGRIGMKIIPPPFWTNYSEHFFSPRSVPRPSPWQDERLHPALPALLRVRGTPGRRVPAPAARGLRLPAGSLQHSAGAPVLGAVGPAGHPHLHRCGDAAESLGEDEEERGRAGDQGDRVEHLVER